MLSLRGNGTQLCDGLTRREILRVGGLGVLGLGLPQFLAAGGQVSAPTRAQTESSANAKPRQPSAKSCIVLFLMGGPPQHSTWDPKPEAPAEIRGEFKPIDTVVPGIRVSELLPRMALLADRL